MPDSSAHPSLSQSVAKAAPMRQPFGAMIVARGFSECEALPAPLCAKLNGVSMAGALAISNAWQQDVPAPLATQIGSALRGSAQAMAACLATFGTSRFDVVSPKILEAWPGACPQIPHADDHWKCAARPQHRCITVASQ